MFQENASGWILLVARKQQATRAYKRTGELDEGFYPLLTKTKKNCRCHQLLIDGFAAIHFFTRIAEYRLRIKKEKIQTPNFMMRVYSSLLMSSLLLITTAVNAQSLETRSTFFAQGNPGPEFLTALADTQSLYAADDKDKDKDKPPPRGSGRENRKN